MSSKKPYQSIVNLAEDELEARLASLAQVVPSGIPPAQAAMPAAPKPSEPPAPVNDQGRGGVQAARPATRTEPQPAVNVVAARRPSEQRSETREAAEEGKQISFRFSARLIRSLRLKSAQEDISQKVIVARALQAAGLEVDELDLVDRQGQRPK